MRRILKSLLSITAVTLGVITIGLSGNLVSAGSAKTGVGLSDHAVKAYRQGWKYKYGAYGQKCGGTRVSDCAGLIKSYLWWKGENANPSPTVSVGGGAGAMLASASKKGVIDYSNPSSLPRVHGLILYQPGHVGVYVGNNRAVDNRDVGYDVKYEPVFGRARKKWTMWFKLPQINYPTNGWAKFDGKKYYYENGQYIVNTTRTINGQRYTFGADGVAKGGAKVEVEQKKSTVAKKKNETKKAVAINKKKTLPQKAAVKTTVKSSVKNKEKKTNLSSTETKNNSKPTEKSMVSVSSENDIEKELVQRRARKMERSFDVTSSEMSGEILQVSLPRANEPPAFKAEQQKKTTVPISASAVAFLLVMMVAAASGIFIFTQRARRAVVAKRYAPQKDITFKNLFLKK